MIFAVPLVLGQFRTSYRTFGNYRDRIRILCTIPLCVEQVELADQNGTTVESLFENRLAVCFRILGFKVEDFGQGTGRNPDGIFTYRGSDSSYAVIYDAKSSAEPYRLRTTDERQFEDYINQHIGDLQRRGFDNIYFAVVSGSFIDEAREAI